MGDCTAVCVLLPAQVDSDTAAAKLLPTLLEQCWSLVLAKFPDAKEVLVRQWTGAEKRAIQAMSEPDRTSQERLH